jgi:hypothetical protein
MSSSDQLSEQDRIELLARARDAWQGAPQNTMKAVSIGVEKTTSSRTRRLSCAFTQRKASRSTDRKAEHAAAKVSGNAAHAFSAHQRSSVTLSSPSAVFGPCLTCRAAIKWPRHSSLQTTTSRRRRGCPTTSTSARYPYFCSGRQSCRNRPPTRHAGASA